MHTRARSKTAISLKCADCDFIGKNQRSLHLHHLRRHGPSSAQWTANAVTASQRSRNGAEPKPDQPPRERHRCTEPGCNFSTINLAYLATHRRHMERGDVQLAMRAVSAFAAASNQLIEQTQPWKLAKAMNEPQSSRPPGFKVETIYAIVATDGRGEGIPSIGDPAGRRHLLVDCDARMVEWFVKAPEMAPVREQLAQQGGFKVLKFERPVDVTEEFLK